MTNDNMPEPVAWHVCSVNSDGSLSLEHAAAWKEAAHEHINDAINEHDIEEAATWVVRPVYPTDLIERQAAAIEALLTAAKLSRFCLQELLPNDPDAEFTLRVIDAAIDAAREGSGNV